MEATGRFALGVTLLCLCLLGTTGALVVSPRLRGAAGVGAAARFDYTAGETTDLPSELFSSTRFTVVLFLRSSCGACREASPAIQRLVAELSRLPDVGVLMVTGRAALEDEYRFAARLGIGRAEVAPMDLRALRLHSVPAALLIDRAGTILHAESGSFSDDSLAALLRAAMETR